MALSQDVLDRVNAAYREFVSQINSAGPNSIYLECQGNQDAIRKFAKSQVPSIPLELFQETFVWTECWMRARAAGLLMEPERPLSEAEKRDAQRIRAEELMAKDRRIDLGHRSYAQEEQEQKDDVERKRKAAQDTKDAAANLKKNSEDQAKAQAALESFDNIPTVASLREKPLSNEEEIALYRKFPRAVTREYSRRKGAAQEMNFVVQHEEKQAAIRAKRGANE